MTQNHVDALESTIAASETLMLPVNAALVALARTLAQQMLDSGAEPSTRLSAAYLSVLKDLHRVVAASTTPALTGKTAALRKLREGHQLKAVN